MKKILFLSLAIVLSAYPISNAYDYKDQKRGSIVEAIKEKPDLKGEDKHSIEIRFGLPIFRKTSSTPEGKKELWVYRPFKGGLERIKIIFLDGRVAEVDYGEKESTSK